LIPNPRSGDRRWEEGEVSLTAPADDEAPAVVDQETRAGFFAGRRRRLLLAGSVFYLALIFGVMLWRGIEIEPEWVVLALLLIAAALGRGRQFIFDFVPFLLLFFAYEVMRGFAAKTGFAPHDLAPIERGLFGGQVPTLLLQHALYQPNRVGPLDLAATFLYYMHFALLIGVGFIFWLRSRDHYWRFVAALLLMCLLAFVTFLFFPSTPPWLQFPAQVHKIEHETVFKLGLGFYASPLYSNLNPNLYAAFPSLHAAFPFLGAVYAWRRLRLVSIVLLAWSAAVWFAIVYLGEHYVIDAIDGMLYVGVATAAVELVVRFQARRVKRAGET
jgi:hypothetical protein